MTLIIDLTPEQEARLQRRADVKGIRMMDVVLEMVEALPDETESKRPRTGAEIVAYWERNNLFGLFAEGLDSPELAEQLRRQAEHRDWSGE